MSIPAGPHVGTISSSGAPQSGNAKSTENRRPIRQMPDSLRNLPTVLRPDSVSMVLDRTQRQGAPSWLLDIMWLIGVWRTWADSRSGSQTVRATQMSPSSLREGSPGASMPSPHSHKRRGGAVRPTIQTRRSTESIPPAGTCGALSTARVTLVPRCPWRPSIRHSDVLSPGGCHHGNCCETVVFDCIDGVRRVGLCQRAVT
jgi:hypothetical protein